MVNFMLFKLPQIVEKKKKESSFLESSKMKLIECLMCFKQIKMSLMRQRSRMNYINTYKTKQIRKTTTLKVITLVMQSVYKIIVTEI